MYCIVCRPIGGNFYCSPVKINNCLEPHFFLASDATEIYYFTKINFFKVSRTMAALQKWRGSAGLTDGIRVVWPFAENKYYTICL